uniref:Uncharacterized protein n=1 Tax=Wuchereria bancrofti TaxID=6293 RepID=A0A1I8ELI6_WUCBA
MGYRTAATLQAQAQAQQQQQQQYAAAAAAAMLGANAYIGDYTSVDISHAGQSIVQCCVINDVCLVNPGTIHMVVESQPLHNISHSKQNSLLYHRLYKNKIPTNTTVRLVLDVRCANMWQKYILWQKQHCRNCPLMHLIIKFLLSTTTTTTTTTITILLLLLLLLLPLSLFVLIFRVALSLSALTLLFLMIFQFILEMESLNSLDFLVIINIYMHNEYLVNLQQYFTSLFKNALKCLRIR